MVAASIYTIHIHELVPCPTLRKWHASFHLSYVIDDSCITKMTAAHALMFSTWKRSSRSKSHKHLQGTLALGEWRAQCGFQVFQLPQHCLAVQSHRYTCTAHKKHRSTCWLLHAAALIKQPCETVNQPLCRKGHATSTLLAYYCTHFLVPV